MAWQRKVELKRAENKTKTQRRKTYVTAGAGAAGGAVATQADAVRVVRVAELLRSVDPVHAKRRVPPHLHHPARCRGLFGVLSVAAGVLEHLSVGACDAGARARAAHVQRIRGVAQNVEQAIAGQLREVSLDKRATKQSIIRQREEKRRKER